MTEAVSERLELLGRAPFSRLQAYHERMVELKRATLGARAELGRTYLEQHHERDPGEVISPRTGIGTTDLGGLEQMREAIAESLGLIDARADAPVRSKASLDYYGVSADFTDGSAAVQLAYAPEVLCPLIRYFGMLPILAEIDVTRAAAATLLPSTTHMFHADPDDVTQIKVFVHLTDVDAGSGPLHVLPADLSDEVNARMGHPRGRLTDEEVAAVVGPARAFASLGSKGVATFVDTSRCLHFGGRPREPGQPFRDQLVIRFLLPTCAGYPQFEGDGEPRWRMGGLQPRATDRIWNAFIGVELV